jgi:hypothetical protein
LATAVNCDFIIADCLGVKKNSGYWNLANSKGSGL